MTKVILTQHREIEIAELDSDRESNDANGLSDRGFKNIKFIKRRFYLAVFFQKQNIELPPIKLPVFNKNWPEFRDTFLSLKDSGEDLDNTQKFYYFRLNLEKKQIRFSQSVFRPKTVKSFRIY